MKVRDFMSKNLVYVSPETSVTDAKALMMKEKISKLPVLDKSNRLVGLITKNPAVGLPPYSAGAAYSQRRNREDLHRHRL